MIYLMHYQFMKYLNIQFINLFSFYTLCLVPVRIQFCKSVIHCITHLKCLNFPYQSGMQCMYIIDFSSSDFRVTGMICHAVKSIRQIRNNESNFFCRGWLFCQKYLRQQLPLTEIFRTSFVILNRGQKQKHNRFL